MRKYYEAYDDRYRQVHEAHLQWFARSPSPIISEIISEFSVSPDGKLLEIGCGEGRDAVPLLDRGFDLLATDISGEAIRWCKAHHPEYADRFRVMNCVTDRLDTRFRFIYAVAVVHMLVEDADRMGFYTFIREHLEPDGIALICTMGDGSFECRSDIRTAFDLQKRIHEESGKTLCIAGTSYRAVSFDTFTEELERADLAILKLGTTRVDPDYAVMMYAVVKGK